MARKFEAVLAGARRRRGGEPGMAGWHTAVNEPREFLDMSDGREPL